MSIPDKNMTPKSKIPSHAEVVKQQRQKEEGKEVIGKHKNDGKKDHKGAR